MVDENMWHPGGFDNLCEGGMNPHLRRWQGPWWSGSKLHPAGGGLSGSLLGVLQAARCIRGSLGRNRFIFLLTAIQVQNRCKSPILAHNVGRVQQDEQLSSA